MKKILVLFLAAVSFTCANDKATCSHNLGYRLGEAASDAYGFDIEALLGGYQDFIDHKPFPITPSSDAAAADAEEIGYTALGYLMGQTLDLILDADHQSLLNGVQDALAGEEAPCDNDELIFSLFKAEYRQIAQNLQIAIPFLTQLEEDLQK